MLLKLFFLGAVGFEDRVEWWDRICIQLQLLPASIHEILPMLLECHCPYLFVSRSFRLCGTV